MFTKRSISRIFSVLFIFVLMLAQVAPAYAADTWTSTGALTQPRSNHTAILLGNGQVLVVGGYKNSYLSSAELYNPTTGSWRPSGVLIEGRAYYTATLLANGKVLVVGGLGSSGALASAELYDPTTGSWTATGALAQARWFHTATLLANGQVLVVGGGDNYSNALASAELYNPTTGVWTSAGVLTGARRSHTATLLNNGQVLVVGGAGRFILSSAELYDPTTGIWTSTGALIQERHSHTATLLSNGQVLVVGGSVPFGGAIASAELYDSNTGTWKTTGALTQIRYSHTATKLANGQVLIVGGHTGNFIGLGSTEVYNPTTGRWTSTGALTEARYSHTATLLSNGQALVVGGIGVSGYLTSAELYDATVTDASAPTASPSQSPAANGLGWNNSNITVNWNWSDEDGGSGIDPTNCTTITVSSGEGTIILNAVCKDLAGNTGNASYTVMVDKTAPTAQVGDDQHTHTGVTIHLDGRTSFDNNTLPEALSYSWSFSSMPAGNTAVLNNANTATPSFTPNVSGTYIARLVVTDDADNSSTPAYVTLSSLNQPPTGDATATPMLPLLGQSVSLDGSASSDPDLDTISYLWTVTSKPVGSVASLTNATSLIASITPDVSGTYEMTLTVSDFLESGTPVTVSFVASTAAEFAQAQVISASAALTALSPTQVTTAGNQNALGNFIIQTMSQLQNGNVANAISKLNQAIQRTDGCALRGAPDGNGSGMDWVTICSAQASIYNSLIAALQALQP